jgi:hypothetical protein
VVAETGEQGVADDGCVTFDAAPQQCLVPDAALPRFFMQDQWMCCTIGYFPGLYASATISPPHPVTASTIFMLLAG